MTILNMEDSEAKRLIQLLDEGVEKENAKVLLTQYGGGPDESKIIATKEGYLRFGIEIMKAACVDKLDKKEKDSVNISKWVIFYMNIKISGSIGSSDKKM